MTLATKQAGGPSFLGDARVILRQGYVDAYGSGYGDADPEAEDADWGDEADQYADTAVDRQHGYLAGLAVLLVGGALTADQIDARLGQYAATVNPIYERGFSASVQDQGEVVQVTWHTQEDDTVCQLCEDRDGQTWTGDDTSYPFPGEGDFGEICEGSFHCRCWLEYDTVPASAAADEAAAEPELVEAMSTAMLAKIQRYLRKYSPDQERDEQGRFAGGDPQSHLEGLLSRYPVTSGARLVGGMRRSGAASSASGNIHYDTEHAQQLVAHSLANAEDYRAHNQGLPGQSGIRDQVAQDHGPLAVLSHEYGHVVEEHLMRGWDQTTRENPYKTDFDRVLRAIRRDPPSGYATTRTRAGSGTEGFAEAFTAIEHGEPDRWGMTPLLDRAFGTNTATALRKYSPDQPRDEAGRFGEGGGEISAGALVAAAEAWQDPRSMAGIRDSIAAGSPNAEARTLMAAYAQSDVSPSPLYRGMTVTPELASTLTRVGGEFSIPLSSFSSDSQTADGYMVDSVVEQGGVGLRIELTGGAQALNLSDWQVESTDEREFLSAGTFRIDSVAGNPAWDGSYTVRVRQVRP